MFKFPKTNNGSLFKSSNIQSQPNKMLLEKSVSTSPISNDFDTRPKVDTSIKTKISNKRKITEFEELSNVSEERPEIISLSSFSPLYDEFGNKTDSGKLLDVYVETLRQVDAATQKLYSEIQDKKYLKSKNDVFKNEITQIRQKLAEFNALIKSVSLASNNLNLHNKIYDFSPNEFLEKTFDDDDSKKTKKSNLSPIINKLPNNINLDTAVSELLGLPLNVSSKYSSTKLWLLAITELKRLMTSHSRYMLPSSIKQNTDESPSLMPVDNTLRLSLPAFQSSIGDINVNVARISPPETINYLGLPPPTSALSVLDATKNVSSAFLKIDTLLKIVKNDECKIAVVFDLLCKELRYSTCFDQDSQALKSFRGPGTQAINSKNFFDSVFGLDIYGYDIYKKSPDFSTVNLGLSDLAYSRDFSNQNKAVLVLEEKERSNISSELTVGSKYFFDIEDIFTNIIGTRLNLGRIEFLQTTLSRLDNNFFEIASNFGLLPTDDSIFDISIKNPNDDQGGQIEPQKPSVLSSNPYTFIENVLSMMVDENGMSKTHKLTAAETIGITSDGWKFLQMDRGVSSLFALAAQENEMGRNVRSYLFLLLDDLTYSSNNVDIDTRFFAALKGSLSQAFPRVIDVENAIAQQKVNLSHWLSKTLETNFNKSPQDFGDVDGNSYTVQYTKADLANIYESAKGNTSSVYKYIPCKFYSSVSLSKTLRSNPFVLELVSILKELKITFAKYVTKGGTKSLFSGISIDNVNLLFFTAICKMISQFSDNRIVSIAKDDFPVDPMALFKSGYGIAKDSNGTNRFIWNNDGDNDRAESLNFLGIHNYELVLYVNTEYVPRMIKKSEISSYVQKELTSTAKLLLSVLNTLDILNSNVKSIDAVLKKFNSDSMGTLLRYLNNNPRKLSLFLREPQLMLALSTVEDIYQSFNDFNDDDKQPGEENNIFTNYAENIHYYPKLTEIYELLFKDNQEYTTRKGYNKKILTVGVPQGMFDRLLKKSSLNSSNSKHNDIFKISVYKTDVLNGEIIYMPKVFLFEASRYPVRVYSDIKNTSKSDYREIFKAISTRNYSLFVDGKTADAGNPTYWDDKSNSFGNEYSFLTSTEKNEIIENHVMSYILENYMKIVTGLSFDELTFSLDSREIETLVKLEPDPIVLEEAQKSFATLSSKSAREVLNSRNSSISKTNSKGLGSGGQNLNTLSKPTIPATGTNLDLKNFKSASRQIRLATDSSTSRAIRAIPYYKFNPSVYITKLVQPKKFDRVFNIIFDPEFEVDYEKTVATSIGAEKLKLLLRDRKIIQKRPNVNEYVDADKSPQNVMLDSYFVVIETHANQFELIASSKNLLDKNRALQSNSLVSNNLKNSISKSNINNVYKK